MEPTLGSVGTRDRENESKFETLRVGRIKYECLTRKYENNIIEIKFTAKYNENLISSESVSNEYQLRNNSYYQHFREVRQQVSEANALRNRNVRRNMRQ